jgi:hypothetical protein
MKIYPVTPVKGGKDGCLIKCRHKCKDTRRTKNLKIMTISKKLPKLHN